MQDEVSPFKTSDTPLAAFLHFKGMTVMTTVDDPNDPKRRVFVFMDEPERETYVQMWKDDQGGQRSYYASLKVVQHMLFPPKRNRNG